jgi:hypothetical protein
MTARWFHWGSGRLRGEGGVFASHPPYPLLLLPLIPPPPFQPTRGEGEGWRPDARRRRAHRRWRLSRSWSRVHDSGPRRRASPRRAEGVWSLSKYSSSHKDWACRAGLHPPSNADALCAIPPRAPRLYVHQTSSRGGSAVPAGTVGRGCTRRRTRAPCATRQTRTMVNVSENCYNPPKPAQAGFAFHSRGLQPHGKGAYRMYCSISISPTAHSAERIQCSISISPTPGAPIGYRLSAIGYRLSAIAYSEPRRLVARRCAICTIMASHRERPAQ